MQYTRLDGLSRRGLLPVLCICGALASLTALLAASAPLGNFPQLPLILKKKDRIPHTGEWCRGSGAATYSKVTLKRIVDRTVAGLLEFAWHEKKFEASDVIRVGKKLFVVCDSSWSIMRFDERLPLLSAENVPIRPDASFLPPEGEDSGFEAILHDSTSPTDFYVIRESVHLNGKYNAHILKVGINESRYKVIETCPSEITFEGDSKGFEGGVSLRGKDGVLYLLGLCEGNHCSESKGKDAGNGRVVVMAYEEGKDGCFWKTVRVLDLPPSLRFVDYSAIAIHHSTQSVAITSQENSQVWVGKLDGGSDGEFEPLVAKFSEGATYDFPRSDSSCEVIYCNVEGIHWISEAAEGGKMPGTLVAVSDKMKSKGRQPAACHDKDQSVHLFAMP